MPKTKWPALFTLLLLLAALALTAPRLSAQDTVSGTWQAQYWNNTTLSGTPDLTRQESGLSNSWGTGSPAPGILNADRFSARWQRTVNLQPGTYRFELTVDDGARLWVDGNLFIDTWQVQPVTTYTGEISLSGGATPITLEYFENTGAASVQLSWTATETDTGPGVITGWRGEYYNNTTLSGAPALVRDDPAIAFDWNDGSPAPDRLAPDSFSARWTQTVALPAGQYRFTVTADDGVRLWVNDVLLIDAWQQQSATTFAREISLTGDGTALRLDYYEAGGQAEVTLDWQRLHAAPPPATGNTVDNDSAGFVYSGNATDWDVVAGGYDGTLRWTRSSATADPPYNWGRWYPDLTPGIYVLSVYIPDEYSTTSRARYWISHADGYTVRNVDQSANGGRWVTLGTFEFSGNGSDFLSLADVTYESETRLVAYDAARWTPVSEAENAAVTLSPSAGAPGATVTVFGSGFPPGQTIFARIGFPNTEPFGQYGQTTVQADGTAVFNVTIPTTTPGGQPLSGDSRPQLVLLLITEDGTSGTATFNLQ